MVVVLLLFRQKDKARMKISYKTKQCVITIAQGKVQLGMKRMTLLFLRILLFTLKEKIQINFNNI